MKKMKTSNKIVIATATYIVGGILILFVSTKNHKVKGGKDLRIDALETLKEVNLPRFSTIVVSRDADVHIEQSDSNKIGIEYIKDAKTPANLYRVSGDTLYVNSGLRTFVKCRSIHSITGKNHKWIGLINFYKDSIGLKMDGGEMYCYNLPEDTANIAQKSKQFKLSLSIVATNKATVDLANSSIEKAYIQSNQSTIRIGEYIQSIELSLKQESDLNLYSTVGNLSLKKDTSSIIGSR